MRSLLLLPALLLLGCSSLPDETAHDAPAPDAALPDAAPSYDAAPHADGAGEEDSSTPMDGGSPLPGWPSPDAAPGAAPDFGPNVIIFDPSMSAADVQSKVDKVSA